MFETTDVVSDRDPVKLWVLSPRRRTALANVYHRMSRMVEHEEDEACLRIAYNEMWLFCGREGYADEGIVQAFLGRAVQLNSDLLRAVLHQMLCRMIRQAACMTSCERVCCCNCIAAPDEIACIKRVFEV